MTPKQSEEIKRLADNYATAAAASWRQESSGWPTAGMATAARATAARAVTTAFQALQAAIEAVTEENSE